MLELDSHDDIVIPFNRIGDSDWEKNTRLILESYYEFDEQDMPTPVSENDIQEAKKRLGAFPEPLALFYQTFGVADVGEYLLPPDEMKPLEQFWAEGQGPQDEMTDKELSILAELIVFGTYLGNGNMFCFHQKTHEVWYFDHDTTPFLVKLFDQVDDYLKGCLIKLQGNFFERPDKADEEIEDRLIGLFGKFVITKWMY